MALIHAYRASAADKLEAIKQIETQLYARTLIETTRKTQIQSGLALLYSIFDGYRSNVVLYSGDRFSTNASF